jgi:hypothetical protein
LGVLVQSANPQQLGPTAPHSAGVHRLSFVSNTATEVNTNRFTVSWGGSSPVSSVVSFDVFVSDNGGPFTPFLTATRATSAPFTGVPGHTYGFFSIATDAAGNKEPMKTSADVVTVVNGPPPSSSRLVHH